MTRVVLVATSPRLPLLFPPQTWRALEDARAAGRPVWVLDDRHPSLPALDVAEIGWQVVAPAADTGPVGRDLLLVGQGLDMEGVAQARRQADAVLAAADAAGEATLLLPPVNDGPLVQLLADRSARQHVEVEAVYPVGEPKGSALIDLVTTETRLRGPGGCPWDAEQTHVSLARNLIEESYEVIDAIDEGDPGHLQEELGDLLLQVIFHAQIAEDAGAFDIDAVSRGIVEKLVRRHPHVFGDAVAETAAEVKTNWDRIKREEEGRGDPLAGIPSGLPALQLAAKTQKRAGETGFRWPTRSGPVDKLKEELGELLEALDAEPRDQAHLEWEVGDLLFAAVVVARTAGVEPEGALRLAVRRFTARYRRAVELAAADDREPAGLEIDDWLAYWKRAKAELRG
jgi:tetrapyrrole methylase family protein/MazG family protein